jgi:hypothetical protein
VAAASSSSDVWIHTEAHDRDQLEVQCSHTLSNKASRSSEGEHASLDLFFFFPRNVKVSAANYSLAEFYADLTTLLRLDLPDMALADLSLESARSPLADFAEKLARFSRAEASAAPLRVAVKLFGHVFTEAVHDAADALTARVKRDHEWNDRASRAALVDAVEALVADAHDALSALRDVQRRCEPFRRASPPLYLVLAQTDEYCSLHYDSALASLAASIDADEELRDGSGDCARVLEALRHAARGEARYRRGRGFLTWPSDGSAEYFAFRRSTLKRAVQQALYLDTRRVASDKFIRNATGLVAAGLAATWALVAQLPAQLRNLSSTAQIVVLAIPVVAYMAKDRIKELSREWLTNRLRSFDHVNELHAGSLLEAGLGSLDGSVKEKARYAKTADLPAGVVSVRAASRTVQGSELESEQVLTYTRRLEWREERGTHALADGLAMRQIVRLNLRELLGRLDEPRQMLPHFDGGEARFETTEVPKVYHLNVVARLTTSTGGSHLHRTRVVLNKDGIVRLEPIPL